MAYIGKSPTGTGVRSRYYYTATGGETSISGTDDDGRTLTFSDGEYVDVYLNGILLVAGTDYNTTTTNTISGLTALTASDIVEVVVYDIFTVPDAVSKANGGTFGGNVAINGDLTVDTNTLYVDSTNNRVGVVNASPTTALDVTGDITVSGGVYLGGTGSANYLDDYEEGTWTANINFGSNTGSSTGATYSESTGNYVKIGNLVHVQCRIALTAKGSSTGSANITGLPFSSNGGGTPIIPFACWYTSFTGVTRGQVVIGRIDNNSSGIELRFLDGNNEAVLNDTHLTNSSNVAISGSYYTTA